MDIRILSISALAAVSLFGSCGGAGQGESGRKVTAAEFGERWPLTVPEGYVDCVPVDAAIFTSGGRSYALNGMASSKYADIEPIWKDNPDLPGTKISIGPLTDLALELCAK